MTLAEVLVIFMVILGLEIFCTLWMKGQVLHCKRAHLKASNKFIDIQPYKTAEKENTDHIHSLSHFTFTAAQLNPVFLKTWNYFRTIQRLVLSFRYLH